MASWFIHCSQLKIPITNFVLKKLNVKICFYVVYAYIQNRMMATAVLWFIIIETPYHIVQILYRRRLLPVSLHRLVLKQLLSLSRNYTFIVVVVQTIPKKKQLCNERKFCGMNSLTKYTQSSVILAQVEVTIDARSHRYVLNQNVSFLCVELYYKTLRNLMHISDTMYSM